MNRMKLKPRLDQNSHRRHRPRGQRVVRPLVASTLPVSTPTLRTPAVIVQRVKRLEQNDLAKQWVDLTLTILLAAPVAIVTLLAAVLIRLTSKGPAIYSQSRLGRFGQTFTIYKLRTMRHNCEATTGATWSVKGDTRVTPLGKILRRLHIDELPQLWNVWKGEMSLVGPRPERPEIVVALRTQIKGYDRRLEMLPGVTGFAQVHLPPDETTDCVRKKLIFDRYYVRHASLGLDLKILMLTAMKVFGMRRLYACN